MAKQVMEILRWRINCAAATSVHNTKFNGNGKTNDVGVFGVGGFSSGGWYGPKVTFDRRVALTKPWRLHDLRRTAATMMAEMGVAPWIVEAILNHGSGHKAGVAGIYNRAKYVADMRQALERWANKVDEITA